MSSQLALSKESYEKAAGAEKTELEARIQSQENYIAHYRENERFTVSEQSIADYKVFAQKLRVFNYTDNQIDSFMYELQARYTDGQINMRQFIEGANGKTRLMILENQ